MKVTLKKPHTHAGQPYDAGAEIDVTAPEADWLAQQQVIDPPPAPAGASKRGAAAEENKA